MKFDEVSKRFDSGRRHVSALTDLSMVIGEAESVGLVGESGSGKTTLARCLVGLETPTEGRIVVGGRTIPQTMSAEHRRWLAGIVQMVFQDPYSSLNPMRTVGATLSEALGVQLDRPRVARRTVGELLELVGLPPAYAGRKPTALSGGERQRVAIARALALEPKLIVCDEPVSALDVSIQAQILNLLGALRTELGIAYLFITHDLAVVRQIADRVYVLYAGRVVEEGAVDDVLDRPSHGYTQRLVASVPRPDPGWLATSA